MYIELSKSAQRTVLGFPQLQSGPPIECECYLFEMTAHQLNGHNIGNAITIQNMSIDAIIAFLQHTSYLSQPSQPLVV